MSGWDDSLIHEVFALFDSNGYVRIEASEIQIVVGQLYGHKFSERKKFGNDKKCGINKTGLLFVYHFSEKDRDPVDASGSSDG